MQTLKEYWQMMKQTHGDKLLLSFLVFYFIDCLIILWCEPALDNYGNALWMGFSVATTIGLGDYTVTTVAARFFTILLGVYGAVIEAYIPGLIASYYLQKMSKKRDAIVKGHLSDLRRLNSMSKEEKQQLAKTIKQEAAK